MSEKPQPDFGSAEDQARGPQEDFSAGQTFDSGANDSSTVEELRSEIQDLNDRWLRSEAEIENVRRRARRDIEENAKFAAQRLMTDLMDVIDNLQRALASSDQAESSPLKTGVQMVAAQFEDVLKRHGCQRISTEGEAFDPNVHEAIQMVPSALPPGSVVQEVRSGYRLHDRVIRPAQVIVSSAG